MGHNPCLLSEIMRSLSLCCVDHVPCSQVRELQRYVHDGSRGVEQVTLARGLGDGRERVMVRSRQHGAGGGGGVERREERLRGMEQVRGAWSRCGPCKQSKWGAGWVLSGQQGV